MKLLRIFGVTFIAVLAISLIAAAAAMAEPEFNLTSKVSTKSKSGIGLLQNSEKLETVECKKDEAATGEITGTSTVGKIQVIFKECEGKNSNGTTCKATSTGKFVAPEKGLIVTATVKGTLGLVKSTEAKSGVGILFEPESGTTFTEIEGNVANCLTKEPVNGTLAGEVTPVGPPSAKTGKIIFRGKEGVQSIKLITINGKSVKVALVALAGLVTASEETEEEVEFSSQVYVT